jgi:hypothetical protein
MVMLLLASAKEPTGKMPNKKHNTNGKRNRFILTSGNILIPVRPILFFPLTAEHYSGRKGRRGYGQKRGTDRRQTVSPL